MLSRSRHIEGGLGNQLDGNQMPKTYEDELPEDELPEEETKADQKAGIFSLLASIKNILLKNSSGKTNK